MIFLYYLDIPNVKVVKHLMSHILGLTSCYDFLRYVPFRDEFICIFYGSATFIYEFSITLFSFWELTPYLEEFNIFFIWIMGFSFIIAFITLYIQNYFNNGLLLLPGALDPKKIEKIDVLLEQLLENGLNSQNNKANKLKIQGLVERMHKNLNSNINFFYKKPELKQILNENQQINTTKLILIINELFSLVLKDPILIKNIAIYEHISLKYCSFLGSYQENPLKAYYELKTLLNKNMNSHSLARKTKSDYQATIIFLIVSEVISKNIQLLLIETFKFRYEMNITLKKSEKSFEELWKTLPLTEELKLRYVKQMKEIIQEKLKFWESLCIGYNRLDDFLKVSMLLMFKIKTFQIDFFNNINENNLPNIANNAIYLKLMILYNLMIVNDNIKAKNYEEKLTELKKLDIGYKEDCVNTISILTGSSIVLQISLLHEKGKILNTKTEKIASFFGYSLQELLLIKNVNKLMPDLISKNHSLFLNRFIKKGPSKYFSKGKNLFGLNSQRFIFPIKLNINLTLVTEQDFVLSAVLTKTRDSSLTFIFDDIGDILGVSNTFKKEINGVCEENDISQIYDGFKIFWFIPELLEQLPSVETLRKSFEKKESIFEANSNGKISIYIPKNLGVILDFIKKYKGKNEELLKKISCYDDLFIKEFKIILKRFCYIGCVKPYFQKYLARYSLRREIYFTSGKRYLSVFILVIHDLYQMDGKHDMDYLSFSIEKTNTTQTSHNTFMTLRSEGDNGDRNEENKKDNIIDLDEDRVVDSKLLNRQSKIVGPNIINDDINKNINEENQKNNDSEDEKSLKKSDKISQSLSSESEKDNQNNPNKSSVKSEASTIANKGLNFITNFHKNSKISVLLKKIFLLMFLQIMIFFLIDIIYIILIKYKFNEYVSSLKQAEDPSLLLNFYSKSTVAANAINIKNDGLVKESDIIPLVDLLNDMIQTAYTGFESRFPKNNLYSRILYHNRIIVKYIDSGLTVINGTTTQIIPFISFIQQTQNHIFQLSMDNEDYLSYLALRTNIVVFYQEIDRIFLILISELEDNYASFIAFYVYLTVSGIISALLLQFIGYPLYRKYYQYLEKILVLISRIQEHDCDNELYKLKRFLHYLDSANESYMMTNVKKLEGEKILTNKLKKNTKKMKENYSDYKKKLKESKKSYYLTSRIAFQQLSPYNFKIVLFLSIFMIAGYYGGAFLFLFKIRDYLSYSNQIISFSTTISSNLNIINLTHKLLITSNFVEEKTYIDTKDLDQLKDIFQTSLNITKKQMETQIEIPNNIVPEIYLDKIRLVLNNDSCIYDLNLLDCTKIQSNPFKYGLREYISYFLNKLQLIQDKIMNPENLSLLEVQSILLKEENISESIFFYHILERTLSILHKEASTASYNLIDELYSQMFLLFIMGGVLCSVVWGLLFAIRMRMMWSEVELSKRMLLLIPLEKLNEESTMHLMRNLDNF